MTVLRDATAALESAVNDHLGDEITYTPEGGSAQTFNAWVEFENDMLRGPGSASRARRRIVEVPKELIPAVSKEGDRITIQVVPGVTFKPADIEDGESGDSWRITLMKVA